MNKGIIYIWFFISLMQFMSCTLNESELSDDVGFLKLFGKSGLDVGTDLGIGTADNAILLGNYADTITDKDILVLNLDVNGNLIWQKQLGDTLIQNAVQIEILPSGNFYVVGYQDIPLTDENFNTQVSVSYFSADGNEIWTKFFGGLNKEEAVSADLTSQGEIIIAGDLLIRDEASQEEDSDFFIMKINEQGDSLWYRQYGGIEIDKVSQVKVFNDQAYVIGSTRSFGDMGQILSNILLLSVNQSGIINDKATYGGANEEFGNAIIQADPQSFLLLYTSQNIGEAQSKIGVIKVNINIQTIIFDKLLNISSRHEGIDLMMKNNNDFYILANSGSLVEQDIKLLCCNLTADTLWTRSYGSESVETAFSFRKNSHGDLFISGTTGFKGNSMIMILRLNSEGRFN